MKYETEGGTDEIHRLDKETADRIAGRKHAEELISMRETVANGTAFTIGFWREMAKQAAKHVQQRTPEQRAEGDLVPMDDTDAAAFEKKPITFGVHRGGTYGETPITYLEWVVEQGLPLMKYMRSGRAKRRMEEESGDE